MEFTPNQDEIETSTVQKNNDQSLAKAEGTDRGSGVGESGTDQSPVAAEETKRRREESSDAGNEGKAPKYQKREKQGKSSDPGVRGIEGENGNDTVDSEQNNAADGKDARAGSLSRKKQKSQKRWRVHQMAEDYIDLAANMMLHPTSQLGPYGYEVDYPENGDNSRPRQQYPLELISSLGYLKSPLRRPTVIEKWSPYEIALFEAGIGHHGKDFYQIHKIIQSKSTKEVVDFYYIWKKTSHYKTWKKQYVPPGEIISDGEGGGTPIKKPAAR